MGPKLGKGNTSIEEVILKRRLSAQQQQLISGVHFGNQVNIFDSSNPTTWPNSNSLKLSVPILQKPDNNM